LDNSSLDPMWISGEFTHDSTQREKLATDVNLTILNGFEVYRNDNARLVVHNTKNYKEADLHFREYSVLLEFMCIEKDVAGRLGPVVCLINECLSFQVNEILSGWQDFVHAIGREVDVDLLKEFLENSVELFEVEKKKKKNANFFAIFTTVIVMLLCLFLLWYWCQPS
jgi:hypothetical protein